MFSSISVDEDRNFQSRKGSTSKLNNFGKSQSAEKLKKKKIVKEKLDRNKLINIFEKFEWALNELKIDSDNKEILEKLIRIEKVVNEKILLINEIKNKKCKNMGCSKELTLSVENFHSKVTEENVEIKTFSAEFLKKVNCPFCLKPQDDKIKLIQHLDKGCKPEINQELDKNHLLPFSALQILPNNTFKCHICPNAFLPDLKSYFKHLQNKSHVSVYTTAAKIKNYSEFLFCASCKVQVPNNYTQIHFHMNHNIHETNCGNAISSAKLIKKGIYCLYLKSKKFKCLACPLNFYKTPGDIIRHFECQNHEKNFKEKFSDSSVFFCEVCCKEVQIFEMLNHFILSDHKNKEKKMIDQNELCFFCGFVCNTLIDLSMHMESKCSVIDSIRKQNQISKKDVKNDFREDETTDGNNTVGGCVIVKGYKDIPALFSYFEKFGEITSLEMFDAKHIMITFKKKSIAESVLLLKDKLKINGVELEIMTDDKLCRSISGEKQILSENEDSHSSCESSESEENINSDDDRDCIYNAVLQKDQLQTLFQKVTSHLIKISQKLELTAEVKTILKCLKICIGEPCNLVGFASCGLSFPVESISLYCPMKMDSSDIFSTENISINDSVLNTKIFLRKLNKKMCGANFWQNVILRDNFTRSFLHIKCRHKETQKMCTITCTKSAMLLTEMLRDCLKDNDLVRSFCVLIRFWLAVHKLKIRKFEYVIMSLLIFFLINKKVVNLSREKYYVDQDFFLEKKIQDVSVLHQNSSSKESKAAFNLQELFYQFLEFLEIFDFDKLAIYLPLPYPVPKIILLKKLKTVTESSDYDKISKSSMYITESNFLLNLASYVSEEHVQTLLKIVNTSVISHRT